MLRHLWKHNKGGAEPWFCKKGCCIPSPSGYLLQLFMIFYSTWGRRGVPLQGRCGTVGSAHITMRAFGFSAATAASFAARSASRSAGVFAENTCQYMSLPVRRLTP